ncbi:MAG: hypothetical protein HUU54_13395 [Ignavibacteriaceae bacterium]|nr:hypothetical protein [Ignavibacteriaceae bacterium]
MKNTNSDISELNDHLDELSKRMKIMTASVQGIAGKAANIDPLTNEILDGLLFAFFDLQEAVEKVVAFNSAMPEATQWERSYTS